MRLINTKTLELEEMMENEPVEYAILSHTWGKEEVSYQDMLNCNDEIRERKGYWKIQQCARIAAGQELAYIWVDTCCIDKSSSAELSEAINSMYRWYKNARICYAYLEDVVVYAGLSDMYSKDRFSKSRWFTRGWTLQELLAPLELVFYSGLWEQIGRKAEMHAELFTITGIPSYVIASGDLSVANVAQKMSWASKRETSRVEDVAYSLMGIFNVYMPVMYGEGERAFIRLQEKILECSDDHSLFAWRDSFVSKSSYRGLLASSPAEFASSGWIRPRPYSDWGLPMIDSHYSITNKGLCIKLPLAPCGSEDGLCIAKPFMFDKIFCYPKITGY
ncbi:HET-domain-containing protein [Glonium stellatum]|uniref:HET-domain-containing protein n=1 Tax=Glonium stellatum TaxID=574774 RepID=A0A8E2ESY3_9PEZI|nr:HET-domain-containing protein [Glonium stellatum]